jgi:hypothetical protein
MAVLTRFTHFSNPIEWQENRFQQHNIPTLVRRYWLLGPLALIFATVVVIFTLRNITSPTRELAVYLIWIVHAVVAVRAIAAGANAISREHVGKTWDVLVLTGIDTRQILFGKWLAIMGRIGPWMLALGAVRLMMIPVFMLALVNRYTWRMFRGSQMYYGGDYPLMEWSPAATLFAVVMTVVLTILDVMACAALGLATSALTRRGWSAMVAALILRFAPVALFAAFTRYEMGDAPSWRILRFTPLALGDGGTAPLYQLSLPVTGWTVTAHASALPGLAMVSALLMVYLVVSLWVARRTIRLSGALSESEARHETTSRP